MLAIWTRSTYVREGIKVAVIGERRSDRCLKAARASQLRLGINYEQQGKINDALAIYLGIIARYPESEEREVAEERLFRVTRAFFEGSGKVHPAILVYEHLDGTF